VGLDTVIIYVPEVAVLYCKHFRSHPYEIMKWKFEEKRVHISLFQVPSTVCLLTYWSNSICLTVVCYNNYIGLVHNPDFLFLYSYYLPFCKCCI